MTLDSSARPTTSCAICGSKTRDKRYGPKGGTWTGKLCTDRYHFESGG